MLSDQLLNLVYCAIPIIGNGRDDQSASAGPHDIDPQLLQLRASCFTDPRDGPLDVLIRHVLRASGFHNGAKTAIRFQIRIATSCYRDCSRELTKYATPLLVADGFL